MASISLFILYQTYFCIFQMNFAKATLGLKEMGIFLWEGREKSLPCWPTNFFLNHYDFTYLNNMATIQKTLLR